VAGLVVADDDLDDQEDAFITRMLARFGIPEDQRESIFPIIDREEAAAEIKTLPSEVQREALTLLIEAAVADGKVVEEEQDYLVTVGQALGISPREIMTRLEKAMASLGP
jgi:uncharacterized tellurite resistance protein B-like protein